MCISLQDLYRKESEKNICHYHHHHNCHCHCLCHSHLHSHRQRHRLHHTITITIIINISITIPITITLSSLYLFKCPTMLGRLLSLVINWSHIFMIKITFYMLSHIFTSKTFPLIIFQY